MELKSKVEVKIYVYRWSIDLVIPSRSGHLYDSRVFVMYPDFGLPSQDHLASTLASIQEFMVGVSRRLDQIESSRQDPHPAGMVTDETIPHASQTRRHTAASLPAKFRMPDIKRYGIGCPKIHLRLYSTVMRAHGIDDAQLVALFPMSLSGVAQRWFASTRVGGHQTEARRVYFFLCHSLEGKDGCSCLAFSIEEAFARGLWTDTATSPDSKGKKPIGSSTRSGEVGAISYQHQRPAHHSAYRPPTVRAPFSLPQYQYQPFYIQESYIAQTSMQPRPPHPRAATHPPPRPYAQRPARQFTPLGMTLTRAFEKLRDLGVIVHLVLRPLPHPIPPHFRSHEHRLYHRFEARSALFKTPSCDDLIDSGWLTWLGQM
ncbi:hypothetical protein AAG906_013631 [Vitis piasezkii]